jgi:hypothetical protein
LDAAFIFHGKNEDRTLHDRLAGTSVCALDPKTVEGPDAPGRACVHRVMPGLTFPCLAKLYVQADVGTVPF